MTAALRSKGVFDRFFPPLYSFVLGHKKSVMAVVLLLTAFAASSMIFVRYEGNIDLMLPPDKDIVRSMDFLRDSNLSDKMIISLALTDSAKTKKDLFLAVDQLVASLQPPLFSKVISGFSVSGVMDEFSVLQYGPHVLGEQDMARIADLITPEAVAAKMRGIYQQSMRPEGIFTASLSRSDPLGIKMLVLDKLKALPASMNYNVQIEDGHFISSDGRHAMLVIQTRVPMMDSQKCRELVTTVESKLKALPAYVAADIVSGHLHTVSNEKVIKRDIAVASIIASVSFLLLFLAIFRDHRVMFVFIIPLIAVIWAITIASAIEGRLSFLVIGFGSSIAGISIDYGLLVYIAMKRGADAAQMLKLSKLVTIDAATTVFSFVVLFFSLIKGYHQLALFSILCVSICLLFSLFVLPLVLSWKGTPLAKPSTAGDRMRDFPWPPKLCISVWLIFSAVALFFATSVRFDSDLKRFDGTEPRILQMEENFNRIWGGRGNQAILVVTGSSLEEAMQKNDALFKDAIRVMPQSDLSSLAYFWPSEKIRNENRQRWDSFWRDGAARRLQAHIKSAAPQYGFSADAFTPFFDGLYSHSSDIAIADGVMSQLKERYIIAKGGVFKVISFFPDRQEYLDSMATLVEKHPGTFVVSKMSISAAISRFTDKEVRLLAPLAILFNIVLAWLFFRNWKDTLIALVPVFTGVVWFAGIMSLFDIPLNIVNIIAVIVSTGVIVDYGLGMTYEYRYNLRVGTVMAVTLSATTNIIGSGALLFANYPALFSTGIAMVVCMITGYLSSLIIIPSLTRVLKPVGAKQ